MKRKSHVGLRVEKIKTLLGDFAHHVKRGRNWKAKQYQEKGIIEK